MLIRDTDWERVREHFTEEEKAVLRAAVTGNVVCPRGFTVAIETCGETGAKLIRLLGQIKKG